MNALTISPGPRNAHSDPESGLRFYRWQGRDLPSVTTIRRMAGMPHNLHHWTLSQVVDRAVLSHAELTAMLTRERRPRERVLEKNRIAEASRWLRAAATEERDVKAALGTAVHDAAAQGLTPEQVPDIVEFARDGRTTQVLGSEIRPRLRWYRDWLDTSHITIVAAERQVFNLSLGYGGSFDILGLFLDGEYRIVDIKTGSGIYAEHLLQALGYGLAEFVGEDDVIDEELTRLLHQVSGVALLHLSDDGWDFRELKVEPEAWAAFRGLLTFATWAQAHPDAESITAASRTSEPVGATACGS